MLKHTTIKSNTLFRAFANLVRIPILFDSLGQICRLGDSAKRYRLKLDPKVSFHILSSLHVSKDQINSNYKYSLRVIKAVAHCSVVDISIL